MGRLRVAVTMGGRYGNAILALVIGAVIARALHPDGRAVYALTATVAAGAFSLAGLSLDTPVFWAVSELKAGPRAVLAAMRWPVVVATAAALAAYALGAVVFLSDESGAVIGAGALLVPALVITSMETALCFTIGDVQSPTVGLIASGLAQLVMVVGLQLTVGLDPWSVLVVSAVSQLPLLAATHRALSTLPADPDPVPVRPRQMIRIGLEVQPSKFATFLIRRADVLIVSAVVSTHDLGLYTLGVTLAEAMLLSTESIGLAATGSQARGDRDATGRRSAEVASACAIIGIAELLILAIAGRPLIILVFGHAFAGAYPVAVALGFGAIGTAYHRPLAAVFIRHDRRRLYSLVVGAGGVANIGLAYAFVRPYGIVGAGVGSSIATLATAIAMAFISRRAFGTPVWVRPTRGRWTRLPRRRPVH
jgi:O-antigen/teichoic acid export membrane protein